MIEDIEEELKSGEKTDPTDYLLQQLERLNLSVNQKREVKRTLESGEGDLKDRVKAALTKLKETAGNLPRSTVRKLENITPLYDDHGFWDTQPVPKAYETVTPEQYDKPIDKIKTPDDIDPEPINLPPGFYWSNVDITDEA